MSDPAQMTLFDEPDTAPVTTPAGRCQAASTYIGLEGSQLTYRGWCKGCTWRGDLRLEENTATEDAVTHAWPGWEKLPLMPAIPATPEATRSWLALARRVYPPGWVDGGGPIRTQRTGGACRHHDSTPWGGFSIGVLPDRKPQ